MGLKFIFNKKRMRIVRQISEMVLQKKRTYRKERSPCVVCVLMCRNAENCVHPHRARVHTIEKSFV